MCTQDVAFISNQASCLQVDNISHAHVITDTNSSAVSNPNSCAITVSAQTGGLLPVYSVQ